MTHIKLNELTTRIINFKNKHYYVGFFDALYV